MVLGNAGLGRSDDFLGNARAQTRVEARGRGAESAQAPKLGYVSKKRARGKPSVGARWREALKVSGLRVFKFLFVILGF